MKKTRILKKKTQNLIKSNFFKFPYNSLKEITVLQINGFRIQRKLNFKHLFLISRIKSFFKTKELSLKIKF